MAGLSAREQNQLKRRLKQAGKAGSQQPKKAKTEKLVAQEEKVLSS